MGTIVVFKNLIDSKTGKPLSASLSPERQGGGCLFEKELDGTKSASEFIERMSDPDYNRPH